MSQRFQHELVQKARVDLGLTQEEAATAIGIDVRTYRRYESGEVNEGAFSFQRASRRKIVARIAEELGIDESELLVTTPVASEPDDGGETGHTLPRAPRFVGRRDLTAGLVRFVRGDSKHRIVAIVGVGGAGKTSLVEHAISAARDVGKEFIWSFYENPRVDDFLESLGNKVQARPETRGDLLTKILRGCASSRNLLLVLDGLEVTQSNGERGRARGELDDARLKLLLRRLAVADSGARVIITSRFSLCDLEGWEGTTFHTHFLEPLTTRDALDHFEASGVKGSDLSMRALADATAGHALSVAMLGSYVKSFLGGDASRFSGIDLEDASSIEALARRLDRLLTSYADELDVLSRDVMARIAVFPRGLDADAISRIARSGVEAAGALAGATPTAITTALARLESSGLIFLNEPANGTSQRFSAHPLIRRHFRKLLGKGAQEVHEVERKRLASMLDDRPDELPTDVTELDSYEALFEHTLLAGHIDDAAGLLYRTLGGFSHLGLHLGELERGLRMVRAFAAAVDESSADPRDIHASLSPRTRLRLAYEWGLYECSLGDTRKAIIAYVASNEIASACGDYSAHTTGLRTLGYTYRLRGELEAARVSVERSLSLARELSAHGELVRGIALLGAIHTSAGHYDEAKRAFDLGRAAGDVPYARRALWEVECLLETHELPRARQILEANLAVCDRLGWKGHQAHCHVLIGSLVLGESDDAERAKSHLAIAERWCERSGEVEMILRVTLLRAEIAHAEKNEEDFARAIAAGRELATVGGFGLFLKPFRDLEAKATS